MISDKNPKSPLMSRQKIIAIIVVLVLVVVIWQVFGLINSGKPPKPIAPQKEEMTTMNTDKPGAAVPNAVTPPESEPQQLEQTPVIPESSLMEGQQEVQKKYLDKISELQMLRIDKEIEETKQAIAASKLATDTAEKTMRDMIAKSASPAYSTNSIMNASQMDEAAKAAFAAQDYVVISVSMKFNKWNAVIGNQGKLYSVSIGDILTPDGSRVVDISSDGVVLEKNDQRRKVSMLSTI